MIADRGALNFNVRHRSHEALTDILNYYTTVRCRGHTARVLENFNGCEIKTLLNMPVVIIFTDQKQLQSHIELRAQGHILLTLAETHKLFGLRRALIIDHKAWQTIASEMLIKFTQMEADYNDRIMDVTHSYELCVADLRTKKDSILMRIARVVSNRCPRSKFARAVLRLVRIGRKI